jgi:hypothetical protein
MKTAGTIYRTQEGRSGTGMTEIVVGIASFTKVRTVFTSHLLVVSSHAG